MIKVVRNRELQIQSEVIKLLLRDSRDREKFSRKVERLEDRFGNEIYPSLLFITAHLEFKKRTAKKHWREILGHWGKMCGYVKREVDLRVALLDYFIDINKRIKNPKIVEIKIFQKTQQETYIDELTQLYNYRYFMKVLDYEIARASRYHAPLSLVIFDVDDFKHYNDTNGHFTGNKSLKKLAQIIKKSVRNVDVVTRYGGEEFAMLLPETNKEGGLVISERIREKVEKSTFIKGEKQPLRRLTISGGLATLNVDAKTGSELIKKADQALYRAKARGKNQIALYVDERRELERVDTYLIGRLTVASNTGDIFVVQNISEGGFLFEFHKPLPVGTILHLLMNLPGRKTPIQCKAKIRRLEELQKNKKYEIGVSIVHIREPDKKAMQRFIRTLAQKNRRKQGLPV
ncbi:MAG TPA: diguanylate cyclase [Nitrospirae bacterium]|nr:diguanylate cyclase [Nitrospirota bacterium]